MEPSTIACFEFTQISSLYLLH